MKENGATIEDIEKYFQMAAGRKPDKFEKTSLLYVLEDDDVHPNLFELFLICKAVNVSADYLLGLSDEM